MYYTEITCSDTLSISLKCRAGSTTWHAVNIIALLVSRQLLIGSVSARNISFLLIKICILGQIISELKLVVVLRFIWLICCQEMCIKLSTPFWIYLIAFIVFDDCFYVFIFWELVIRTIGLLQHKISTLSDPWSRFLFRSRKRKPLEFPGI